MFDIVIICVLVIVLLLLGYVIYRLNNKEEIKLDSNKIILEINKNIYENLNQNNEKLNKEIVANKEEINSLKLELLKSNSEFKGTLSDNLNEKLRHLNTDIEEFKRNSLDNAKNSNLELHKTLNEFKTKTEEALSNNYQNLLKIINEQLNNINKKVSENLDKGFENNGSSLEKVNIALGKIIKAQENLDALSNEVSNLNMVLNNSQKRGRFGEVTLEAIIYNIFGDTNGLYSFQYSFNEGLKTVRPDAVIILPNDKVLCIDSKFSFVTYEKLFNARVNGNDKEVIELEKSLSLALKEQIKKISSDYINKTRTLNYALMFIPNDGIFSYIQGSDYLYKEVIEYSRKLKVIITCPSLLQPILSNIYILRQNLMITKNVEKIAEEIRKLGLEYQRFDDRWKQISKDIDKLVDSKNNFNITVDKIKTKNSNILSLAEKSEVISDDN